MTTGISIIDRIITAVTVQIQTIDGFRVDIGGIIRGDESAPLGVIVSSVQVVKAGFAVAVVTAIANGVGLFLFYHTPAGQSRKSLPGK